MGSNCCVLTSTHELSPHAARPTDDTEHSTDHHKPPADCDARTPSSVGNSIPSDHVERVETPAGVNLTTDAAGPGFGVGAPAPQVGCHTATDADGKSDEHRENSDTNTSSASQVFMRNFPVNEEMPISPQKKATMSPQALVTYTTSSRSGSAVAMVEGNVSTALQRTEGVPVRNPLVTQSTSASKANRSNLQDRGNQSFSSHKIEDISISIPAVAAIASEAPLEPSGSRREAEGSATPQQQYQSAPHTVIMKSPMTANFTLVTPSNSDAGNHEEISYVYSVAVAPIADEGDATPSALPLAVRAVRGAVSPTTTSTSSSGLQHRAPSLEQSPLAAEGAMQPKIHHHPKGGLVFQSFTLSPSIEERDLASTEEQLLDDVEGQGTSVIAYHGTRGDSLRSAPSGASASQGFQPLAFRSGRSQGSSVSLAANTQSSGASNASSNYFPRVDGYLGFNKSGEPSRHGVSFQNKSSDGSTAETLKSSVSTTLHSSEHRGSSATTTTTTDSFDTPAAPQQKPTAMRLVRFTES